MAGNLKPHDNNGVPAVLDLATETRGLSIDRKGMIAEQITILNSWWKYFHRWWLVHYILGIAAVILSVTVASKPRFLSKSEAFYEVRRVACGTYHRPTNRLRPASRGREATGPFAGFLAQAQATFEATH
jgi:hypothetical protein